jgi:hypothetical protein
LSAARAWTKIKRSPFARAKPLHLERARRSPRLRCPGW